MEMIFSVVQDFLDKISEIKLSCFQLKEHVFVFKDKINFAFLLET